MTMNRNADDSTFNVESADTYYILKKLKCRRHVTVRGMAWHGRLKTSQDIKAYI